MPLAPAGKRITSIVYVDDNDVLAGRAFQSELRTAIPSVTTVTIDRRTRPEELDSLLQHTTNADVVLFSPYIRVIDRKGGIALPQTVADFVVKLVERNATLV